MKRKAAVKPVVTEKKVVVFQVIFDGDKSDRIGRDKTALTRGIQKMGFVVEKAFYATWPRAGAGPGAETEADIVRRIGEVAKAAVVYAIENKVFAMAAHSKAGHWAGLGSGEYAAAFTRQVHVILAMHGVRFAIVDSVGNGIRAEGVLNNYDLKFMAELSHAVKASDNKMKGQRLAKGRAEVKAKAGKCEGVKGWGDYPERRIEMLKTIRILRRLPKGCTKRRSFRDVADALNAQGKLTFSGKQWSASGVANFFAEWDELSEEKQKMIDLRTRAIMKARKGKDEAPAIEGEEAYDDAGISDEAIDMMFKTDAEEEAAAKARKEDEEERGDAEKDAQIVLMQQRGVPLDYSDAKRLERLKIIEEMMKRKAAAEAGATV